MAALSSILIIQITNMLRDGNVKTQTQGQQKMDKYLQNQSLLNKRCTNSMWRTDMYEQITSQQSTVLIQTMGGKNMR